MPQRPAEQQTAVYAEIWFTACQKHAADFIADISISSQLFCRILFFFVVFSYAATIK